MSHIAIQGLGRSFGRKRVLDGVDLTIERGETLVILGVSGSGKTTLFKHLMGSLAVVEGSVRIGETELRSLDARGWSMLRRRLGVVFQHAALLGSFTVAENVGLPLREVDHLAWPDIRRLVVRALSQVYLPAAEILDLKPSQLSGGMRKRVGLARAIIREPELILYDEPTTGLDPVTVSGVNDLIRSLQSRLGVTSVVITHDLDSAFAIADRIAMLHRGRIIAAGTPAEIRRHQHPALRQLLAGDVHGPLTEDYVTRGSGVLPRVTVGEDPQR